MLATHHYDCLTLHSPHSSISVFMRLLGQGERSEIYFLPIHSPNQKPFQYYLYYMLCTACLDWNRDHADNRTTKMEGFYSRTTKQLLILEIHCIILLGM